MNETISHQRFRSRIEYVGQHLETVDAALASFKKAAEATIPKTLSLAQMIGNEEKYPKLNKPVTDANRVVAYSRSANVEYTMVFLYRSFSEYLRSILQEVYVKQPYQVLGLIAKDKFFSYATIVGAGSYERLGEEMVNEIYRSLEGERSTPKLLDKLLKRFDLDVPQGDVTEALKYLEIRHLIIHRDCKVDKHFADCYGASFGLDEGDKVPRRYDIANEGRKAIATLVREIDGEILNIGLADENH